MWSPSVCVITHHTTHCRSSPPLAALQQQTELVRAFVVSLEKQQEVFKQQQQPELTTRFVGLLEAALCDQQERRASAAQQGTDLVRALGETLDAALGKQHKDAVATQRQQLASIRKLLEQQRKQHGEQQRQLKEQQRRHEEQQRRQEARAKWLGTCTRGPLVSARLVTGNIMMCAPIHPPRVGRLMYLLYPRKVMSYAWG